MEIRSCEEYVLNELDTTKKKLEEANNAVRYLQQLLNIVTPIVNYKEEDGKILVGGKNYTLDPEADADLINILKPVFGPKAEEKAPEEPATTVDANIIDKE